MANESLTFPMSSFIEAMENRITSQTQKITDDWYILGLMQKDEFDFLKQHVFYPVLNPGAIELARRGLRIFQTGRDDSGAKVDRRKKRQELNAFRCLTKNIAHLLKVDYIKITEMAIRDFGQAVSIYFEYNGTPWMLKVPDVSSSATSIEAFKREGSSIFQIVLYKEHDMNKHLIDACGSTFDELELAKIFHDAYDKYYAEEPF